MAKATFVPVQSQQPIDDDPGISAMLDVGAQGDRVDVYRVTPNGRAFAYRFAVEEFDEAAVKMRLGGGQYFAQLKGSDGRVRSGGTRSFVVDGPPVAHAPAQAAQAAAAGGGFGFVMPQPQDTVSDEIRRLRAEIDELRSRRSVSSELGVRDLLEIMLRGPAQQQGAQLGEMAKFMELMRPKSTAEEMFQTMKLFKLMQKGGDVGVGDGERDNSDGMLADILNSPLGQALATKVLEGDRQQTTTVVQRKPAPAPEAKRLNTQPEHARPVAQPPQPPALPEWLKHVVGPLASAIANKIVGDPAGTTASVIAEGIADTFPYETIVAALNTMPEGAFAAAIINADAQRLTAYAPRLFVAEGVLRELCTPATEQEDQEPADDPNQMVFPEVVEPKPVQTVGATQTVAPAQTTPSKKAKKAKAK